MVFPIRPIRTLLIPTLHRASLHPCLFVMVSTILLPVCTILYHTWACLRTKTSVLYSSMDDITIFSVFISGPLALTEATLHNWRSHFCFLLVLLLSLEALLGQRSCQVMLSTSYNILISLQTTNISLYPLIISLAPPKRQQSHHEFKSICKHSN